MCLLLVWKVKKIGNQTWRTKLMVCKPDGSNCTSIWANDEVFGNYVTFEIRPNLTAKSLSSWNEHGCAQTIKRIHENRATGRPMERQTSTANHTYLSLRLERKYKTCHRIKLSLIITVLSIRVSTLMPSPNLTANVLLDSTIHDHGIVVASLFHP